ncbi:MAG: hypothetical protein GQ533_02040 [Methanosarcinaceae archaeon]|nr:hypothetical protein [Methanosarcinaceae archaeon]
MVTVYLFTIIFLVFLNFQLPRLLQENVILAMYSGQKTLITEEIAMKFPDAFKAVSTGWDSDLYGSSD